MWKVQLDARLFVASLMIVSYVSLLGLSIITTNTQLIPEITQIYMPFIVAIISWYFYETVKAKEISYLDILLLIILVLAFIEILKIIHGIVVIIF